MSWRDLGSWWTEEVASDPAYEDVVTPLLFDVLDPRPGKTYLEIGSGEGRIIRSLIGRGAHAFGVDISEALARRSGTSTIVGDADELPVRRESVDGVYLALVLEHVADHATVFREAARVTKPGGVMALACNHPVWTSPGSTPITDTDGEVLWRPGEYFSAGSSSVPAGDGEVVFHHRTMASLLSGAADSGWSLQRMIEQPHHEIEDQSGIPRLLACRWSLLP